MVCALHSRLIPSFSISTSPKVGRSRFRFPITILIHALLEAGLPGGGLQSVA